MIHPQPSETLGLRGPRLVDAAELRRLAREAPESALAVLRFGAVAGEPEPTWLEGQVPNTPIVVGSAAEVWPAAAIVRRFELHGASLAEDGVSLFATFAAPGVSGEAIERAAYDGYDRMLRAARDAGYPHLLRIWNFVPGINDRSSGLERYQSFCKGRSEALSLHLGERFPSGLPAATAVGCPGDTLCLHAIASREAGQPVENPRQRSAYRYPACYGPKSPAFARGVKAPAPWNGSLFVSGTASISGYESVFPADPEGQVGETLKNLEAVLDAAGAPGAGDALGQRLDSLRVYVRFPRQVGALRAELRRLAGLEIPAVWLQAEICREELLVEIEATARVPGS